MKNLKIVKILGLVLLATTASVSLSCEPPHDHPPHHRRLRGHPVPIGLPVQRREVAAYLLQSPVKFRSLLPFRFSIGPQPTCPGGQFGSLGIQSGDLPVQPAAL